MEKQKMNINDKQKLFDAAIKIKACAESIAWIDKIGLENVTLNNLPADWGLWAVGKIGLIVSDEQFERWGNKCPNIAIEYASFRCTDEQFNRWGNRCPWIVIESASSRCTDEQKKRWRKT